MANKIICAVDIGHLEQDKSVLHQAALLAEMEEAELDVITVIQGFGMSVIGTYFPKNSEEKMLEEANSTLHKWVKQTLGENSRIPVRHIVAEGVVYEEVLRAAKKVEASTIVIGAHRPDLKDFLLGPNAARVARHAACSVYIVRD